MAIWDKDSYKAITNCLINHPIYDYDIRHANISILKVYDMITDEQFNALSSMPKLDREIAIGYMIRNNKELSTVLHNGFKQARKVFITANRLDESTVLETRKDSIVTLERANKTRFGCVEFVLKNVYTSFYKIPRYEFFYGHNNDSFNNNPIIEIKGISNESLNYHKNYFLKFLLTVFDMAERSSLENVIYYLDAFSNKYVNKQLPIQYYREFNSNSKFILTSLDKNGNVKKRYGVDTEYINTSVLDISYNFGIINELYKILVSRYL